MRRKLIFFLILIFIILGAGGYFYSRSHIYSKDIIKMEILGPSEINVFDEINYVVGIKNNGNFRLDDLKLIFHYPKGTIVDSGSEIREMRLGSLYPGEEKNISFKGRIVGKEGEIKIAKATLIFRPKDLKSFYESNTTFSAKIEKSPLGFDLDLPLKTEPGKAVQFDINYFSNIDYSIPDLGFQLDYPDGFEFKSSNPSTLDPSQFDVGLLNKGEGGRISINGEISGDVGESKIFKVIMGVWNNGSFIPIKEISRGVKLVNPSLYVVQEINNNPQYVASPGDLLHYVITVRNIGDDSQTDLFLVVKLEGKPFDFNTIKSVQGDFEPGDNSLIFDWRKIPDFRYLEPQKEIKLEFWINLKDDWGFTQQDVNSTIKTEVYIGQLKEEFETKVNSKLVVVQKGYYQDEVFGNSGPVPPKVGKSTTYTITWQVKNYYNKVKDVKVKSILPQNVELTGKIFPENESSKFAFDPRSREIIWSVGDLDPGILEKGPNISFQVKLTPTEDQKGKTPNLIEDTQISGEDEFTGQEISNSISDINTTLPDDSTVSEDQGIVQ